jgi:hypothetical protein
MNNRSSCNPVAPAPAIDWRRLIVLLCAVLCGLALPRHSQAADAPQWMHAVASAPLPAHDEKTDAILLYSERAVNVQSLDKIKTRVRVVYKILKIGRAHV